MIRTRTIGAMLCLTVLYGVLGLTWSMAADTGDSEAIRPGVTAAVIPASAELRMGDAVVAELAQGTLLKVMTVLDEWVAAQFMIDGKPVTGWIKLAQLRVLKNGERPAAPGEAELAASLASQSAESGTLTPSPDVALVSVQDETPAEEEPPAAEEAPAGTESAAEMETNTDQDAPSASQPEEAEAAGETTADLAPEETPLSAAERAMLTAEAQLSSKFDIRRLDIVDDATLEDIKRSYKLGRVVLAGQGVTDASLKLLSEFDSVDALSIEQTQITTSGLLQLKKLEGLRSLRLWRNGWGQVALLRIRDLSSLEMVDIEGTNLRGRELGTLAELKKLQTLVLGPAIEDDDLGYLEGIASLRELDLRASVNLSNAAVGQLARLKTLTAVWLPQQIGDDAVTQLQKSLPGCKVQR